MKRRFSDAFKEDEDTPDTIIDGEDSDNESVDAETQGVIDTISEYIAEGNWRTASELIDENRIDINSISSSGEGFLHTAIINGNLAIVIALLVLEADPNILNEAGLRPLSLAVNYKVDKAIIKRLLEHGANPNLANDDGSFPMHLALEKDVLEILKLLAGPNSLGLSAKRILGGKYLLHHLIKLNLPDGDSIAEFLISNGDLDVNEVNIFGATPLHEAARIGNISMIRELLRYMPDAAIRDGDGNTALDVAISNNQYDATMILGEYVRLEGQELAGFVYDVLDADVLAIERVYDEDEWVAEFSSSYIGCSVNDVRNLDSSLLVSLF